MFKTFPPEFILKLELLTVFFIFFFLKRGHIPTELANDVVDRLTTGVNQMNLSYRGGYGTVPSHFPMNANQMNHINVNGEYKQS